MKRCLHTWKFSHEEPHGEDRVLKHFICTKCPAKRRRNVKKARFTRQALLQREKPKTSQKPRKPLKQRSDKRKAQEREYSKLRKTFLERRPYCEVEGCGKPATDVHHGAGKEGEWLLREEFWWPACRACHDRCEQNRKWAKERGYLKLRLTTDQLNSTTD